MSLNRFERMVALPEEEYLQLKSLLHTKNPLENKFKSLSSDYQNQDHITDPYTRVQRQGETLHEMKRVKDELSKRLLISTPKPYQARAQSLYQYIENKMSVNDRGEMVKTDGTVIHGSNIADLIQHAVRDRRRKIIPVGWSDFLNILRDNNTPRMIMNYETLEELLTPQVKEKTSLPFTFTAPKAESIALKKNPVTKKVAKRTKKEPVYLKDYLIPEKRSKYI